MVFSSLIFICIFLPAVLLLYNLSRNMTYKNIVLVIFSVIFYAWGEPVWVLALIFSALVDYFNGRAIGRFPKYKKVFLLCSLIVNLGLLGIFKYSGFVVENINALLGINIPFYGFSLPLGISFYTFQTMSYTIDVYRGEVKVQKSFIKFMAYVSMFPQLVAGPIVRYIDIEGQIDDRHVSQEDFEAGILRFVTGLFKKVVLANSAGKLVTMLIGGGFAHTSAATAWLGIVMYPFQIYFDFSGYSDMAIGMGRFFGFRFLENFDYPYISKNATEFWRRWHISLGTFFRDYVYIPLGGNRRYHIRNILVVWFLTGLWHGASWNFILWGLYYGIILIIEKKLFKGALLRLPKVMGVIYSMVIVIFGWSLFYFTDLSQLGAFLKCAFGGSGVWVDYIAISTFLSNIWLIVVLIIASTPLTAVLARKVTQKAPVAAAVISPVVIVGVIFLCFTLLVGETYNPFLYFRF